ncbi:MAG: porin [Burkholderiaceae bacterium]
MRLNLKSAILGSALVVSSGVYAQSNVTIYGVIDYGISYASNVQVASAGSPNGRTGASQWAGSSGVLQANRLGFRGVENLGGGYSSLFVLENGFDLGTGSLGQGGSFFGRQSFVGLVTPIGKVTLGRQYDEMAEYLGPMSAPIGNGAYSDRPSSLDNVGLFYRVNNAVKFTSQKYAGITYSILYSPGEAAASFGKNSIKSAGLSYSNGPLTVAAGYVNANSPNQSYFGDNPNSSTTANNLGPITGVTRNPAIAGFASAHTLESYGVGAQYALSRLTVGGVYSHIRFIDLNSSSSGSLALTNPLGYTESTAFDNVAVYGTYFITPDVNFNLGYNFLTGGSIGAKSGARFHTFNATIQYLLSKRTTLYVNADYQRAMGTDSTGQAAVANMPTLLPSNDGNQIVTRVGMRHTF